MIKLISILAVGLFLNAPAQRTYPAKLGTFYLLGRARFVPESKKKLESGTQRQLALVSARTCLAFATNVETIVAPEGKLLLVLSSTIKNPESFPAAVTTSRSFGLRIYDTKFTASDTSYRGSFGPDLRHVDSKLRKGETVSMQSVYELPDQLEHLRIGIYWDGYNVNNAARYDLTSSLPQSSSVFAKSKLAFVRSATSKMGETFDLDDLNFRVVDCEPIESNGYRVRVEIKNSMLRAGRWGFQYAKAVITDESGNETASYPDFYPTSGYESWGNEIGAGNTVVGDYKFYPNGRSSPKAFKLTTTSTKRSVTVSGL